MLQYPLQHKVSYWLRTCIPDKTMQMAELVDECVWEATKATTRVEFMRDSAAMVKLKLPARLEGGGIKSQVNIRNPPFLGALLDALHKMVDIKNDTGAVTRGYFAQ
jgi:hypothetical protein